MDRGGRRARPSLFLICVRITLSSLSESLAYAIRERLRSLWNGFENVADSQVVSQIELSLAPSFRCAEEVVERSLPLSSN